MRSHIVISYVDCIMGCRANKALSSRRDSNCLTFGELNANTNSLLRSQFATSSRNAIAATFEFTNCDLKRYLTIPFTDRSFEMPRKQISPTAVARVQALILTMPGERVILDADHARIYGVTTARLNQQVRRNVERFPADFAFQLTEDEFGRLKLQNATSKTGRGGRRKLPLVFTEHGAIMAANVLNAPRAVQMSVYVVRAFITMRKTLSTSKRVARQIESARKEIHEAA